MSTNYYAAEKACDTPCEHCKPQELHIGKNGSMFQGYERTPWGSIRSWQDWKDAIRTEGLIVTSEYGTTLTADQFVAMVEATPIEERRRQYEWVVRNRGSSSTDWLDGDQFSFTSSDFT